jgi:S-adenosyl-L-methionine hydrolase (adenosine-forming)
VSHTFHGRDIFAPVAAHIAAGVAPGLIGKTIGDPVLLDLSKPQVLHVDRFGNVITNLRASEIDAKAVSLEIGGMSISKVAEHYAEIEPGGLFLIEGSSGYIEISMNRGPAAERIGCRAGDPIKLTGGS